MSVSEIKEMQKYYSVANTVGISVQYKMRVYNYVLFTELTVI